MTLRDRQRAYYYQQLDGLFPRLRQRYEKQYGERYECPSPRAKELWAAFSQRCEERGLFYEMRKIVSAAKGPYDWKPTQEGALRLTIIYNVHEGQGFVQYPLV